MAIVKAFEFGCDHCRQADFGYNCTKKEAVRQYRESGGIVTQDGKCFCDKGCYNSYKFSQN